jgi:NAD(P)-dependent dehydrogenase (short-subunit alcohol dehydrogenase family)
MLLPNKNAVIYGAGGAIGGAVARAFAREGATVFLSGRNRAKVDVVAEEIVGAGGRAESAEIDALDEFAIDKHLSDVTAMVGGIDISLNAIGIPNSGLQGAALVDLAADQFFEPIATYTRSTFLTARLAVRRMLQNRSGVILTVSSFTTRSATPLVGGVAPAMAAVEALIRDLSVELAPHGIRVVGLRTQALSDSDRIKELFELHGKAAGITPEQFQMGIASRTHTHRLPTLAELANVAVFMASDPASAITGSFANLSMGTLDD